MLSTRPQCSNRPTFPDSGALRLVYAVQMKAILLSFISFACSLICMELTVILYLLSRGAPSEPPRGPMRVSVDPPEPYWRLNHACPRLANPPRQSYLLQHGLENARSRRGIGTGAARIKALVWSSAGFSNTCLRVPYSTNPP